MRRTFALAALAVAAAVALVIAVPAALAARSLAAGREPAAAQREMAAVGFVVARSADPAAVAAALAPGGGLPDGPGGGRIIVIMPDGHRVGTGAAVMAAPPVPYGELARVRARTAAVEIESGGARIVLQPVPAARGGTAVIQYWTPAGEAPAGTGALWSGLAVLALAAAGGAAVAGHRFGARGARLAGRFGRAAGAVRTGEVVVRIEPAGPAELREAAAAFNAMSERVASRLAAERRMAGDLPHRLRTPLTALRLRVDRLGGGAREDAARAALDRLEQEVDLLIRTARVPGGIPDGPDPACDAAEVVAERAAYWSALAEDQGRRWRLSCPDRPVPVPLGRDRLATALDALLGNVFHHTPEGTAYEVALEPGTDGAVIVVSDAGPGIADPEAAARRGGSGAGSTGLGLDIARGIAESGGGGLRMGRSPAGGARILFWTRLEPEGAA
ncbi:HAMP domain-containing sensor histidine kinase [Spirillospora sp. NPDC029432]|uniref:sensor histidine kinase n=1 Tax=Spirillospora sp. NPDC029432 TaxID=3154599 RepID=UPI00345621B7